MSVWRKELDTRKLWKNWLEVNKKVNSEQKKRRKSYTSTGLVQLTSAGVRDGIREGQHFTMRGEEQEMVLEWVWFKIETVRN